MKSALVLGAGGFIGSHMVKRLKSEGYWVRGVDLKYPEYLIKNYHLNLIFFRFYTFLFVILLYICQMKVNLFLLLLSYRVYY
jgi:nucleoside-diphosphate-sugar epimerase